MTTALQNLQVALGRATSIRPKVGGFPHFAEALHRAGVIRNIWSLPSCQSLFVATFGNVAMPGTPLISEMAEVPAFDQDALIVALRTDQAGESTFPEFLEATWKAGVVSYDVDFSARKVSYFGVLGEVYVEEYPAVDIS